MKDQKCPSSSQFRLILGINSAYHESSVALVKGGELVCAVEEERFSGLKHGKRPDVTTPHHLPFRAIRFCLDKAGISWRDLDAIAYSLDPLLRWRQVCLGTEGDPLSFGHPTGEKVFQANLSRLPGILRQFCSAPLYFVPHHLCHGWYAMGTSPFASAAVLVMDGIGEGASVTLGRTNRMQLTILEQTFFPHSLGLAWEKIARFLGFSEYDAGKVMALAGLHPRVPNEEMPLDNHLCWHDNYLHLDQEIFDLEHPDNFSGLENLFQCRQQDACNLQFLRIRIAAAMQQVTERLLLAMARALFHLCAGEEKNLVYGGGVALNCRANLELARASDFSSIHIGPAAHDAGTALGAAWYLYASRSGLPVPLVDPSLIAGAGPVPDSQPVKENTRDLDGTCRDVIRLLTRGEVVGWLEGPCEFGPRALGRRSLVAAPLSKRAIVALNRLKGRYGFEPLAVSVPIEQADILFDIPAPGRHLTPYMLMAVFPRPEWRGRLAHLVHGDGSVRIQTVNRADHPLFHGLLLAVQKATGLPVLLNTSFNPRGLPMPATLDRAIPLAEKLGIRYLVVDGRLYDRRSGAHRMSTVMDPSVDPFLVQAGYR